jgi:hypothetical protein
MVFLSLYTINRYSTTYLLYADLFVILRYIVCLNCTCIYALYDYDLFHIL